LIHSARLALSSWEAVLIQDTARRASVATGATRVTSLADEEFVFACTPGHAEPPMPDAMPTQRDVADGLARDLLRIHQETYGKGAGRAKALVGEDIIVVVLDDLALQQSEEFLIGAGEGRAVIELRARFQQAIETTFRAAAERATGRRVISFASVTKLDPNYVVEIFRLGARTGETEGSATG